MTDARYRRDVCAETREPLLPFDFEDGKEKMERRRPDGIQQLVTKGRWSPRFDNIPAISLGGNTISRRRSHVGQAVAGGIRSDEQRDLHSARKASLRNSSTVMASECSNCLIKRRSGHQQSVRMLSMVSTCRAGKMSENVGHEIVFSAAKLGSLAMQ
jgi:hypothetical protein